MLYELNSDLETVTLKCAEAIAEYVHFGQKDKQGRPYIEHVQRVAKACRNLSLDQRIAAILHDVLEDHEEKLNASGIEGLFGSKAAEIVAALSRIPELKYEDYIDDLAKFPLAISIKLADLADNLDPARGPIPDSLRERYEKAAVRLLAVAQSKQCIALLPSRIRCPEKAETGWDFCSEHGKFSAEEVLSIIGERLADA